MASIVETAPLVLNIGVVLGAAATMGFAARKVGLPSVIGFLATGLLVSPFTPGFVADNNQLALLADIERFPAVSVPLHDRLESCTSNHHMQLRSREDRRHE